MMSSICVPNLNMIGGYLGVSCRSRVHGIWLFRPFPANFLISRVLLHTHTHTHCGTTLQVSTRPHYFLKIAYSLRISIKINCKKNNEPKLTRWIYDRTYISRRIIPEILSVQSPIYSRFSPPLFPDNQSRSPFARKSTEMWTFTATESYF